jgi:hypothetical protein
MELTSSFNTVRAIPSGDQRESIPSPSCKCITNNRLFEGGIGKRERYNACNRGELLIGNVFRRLPRRWEVVGLS